MCSLTNNTPPVADEPNVLSKRTYTVRSIEQIIEMKELNASGYPRFLQRRMCMCESRKHLDRNVRVNG